jgi:hypothetical protein
VRALGARVKDCATFVGRSQLLGVVACLRVAALFTWVVDDGVGLDLALVVLLHVGAEACAERRREGGGLGGCGDGFARSVYIMSVCLI